MHGKLALVHTVPPLLNVFNKLSAELLPGVQLVQILDEPLLERIRQRGRLASEDATRLQTHVDMAEQIGARAMLVTCSTVSPCVNAVRPKARIPVQRIDEAMIAEAVRLGPKIGIVATSETTVVPTQQSLQVEAGAVGGQIVIEPCLVEGALSALLRGDGDIHDKLVKNAVLELARRVDVVVLAQASMARVLDVIPETEPDAPILSSPHLALAGLRHLFATAVPGTDGD